MIVHVKKGKYFLIITVSWLTLSNEALNHDVLLILLLIRIFYSLNSILLPLFMLSKLNIAL